MSAPWWRGTTVYQIYPRSFADSNGDGIGDLPGIVSRIDYLRDLGVETLWISPFFRSPQRDFGYDISDHYDVAPEYGTLDDVRALFEGARRRGLRVVLDMVLNHTSAEHPWFQESRDPRSPRRDWYLWRPGRGPGGRRPPNNWRSMLGGRGWHRDEASGEWYFASFLPFQPDLNYRNPAVKAAMLAVVRHWLDLGADGLRLDIFNAIYKDAAFADNPPHWRPLPSEDDPNGFFQRCLHTIDHPDTLAFARELRAAVDACPGGPRFLVGEVFGAPHALRRYCEGEGLNLVFLFKAMRTPPRADAFRALIAEFEAAFPDPLLPTWVFGNHDRPRLSARLGVSPELTRLLATLQLTARGVPFLYYGEEIGLPHSDLPLREALDPIAQGYRSLPGPVVRALRRRGLLLNRDECRAPMPWTPEDGAGFGAPGVRPWLPLHPSSATLNVAAQSADETSVLACYRRLLRLRREAEPLRQGALALLPAPPDVLAYRREAGGRALEVHLNFARRPAPAPAVTGRLLFSTHGPVQGGEGAGAAPGPLRPLEGVVLERDAP